MEDFRQFNFEILLIRWYRFMRSHVYFILIFSILGLGLAFAYNKIKTPKYESKAIVYSSLVKDHRVEQILADLSIHIQKQSFKTLAELLNIAPEQASKIRSIEVKSFEVKSNTKTDPNLLFNDYLYNCVEITLEVYDTGVIKAVESGIMNYLNQNAFLSKIKQKRDENLKAMITKTEEQIIALEKLQENSTNTESKKGTVINNDINSTSRDMLFLMESKAKFEEELALNSVEIIKPFIIPEKPDSKNLLIMLAGLVLGFFAGTGIAVVRKINSVY